MKNEIAIIGSGGHAKSILNCMNPIEFSKLIGYIDLLQNKNISKNVKYLGNDNEFLKNNNAKTVKLILGISYTGTRVDLSLRKKLIEYYEKRDFWFQTIISDHSLVSPNSRIGKGTFIASGVIINNNSQIGPLCSINTGSIVEHDVKLGKNVQIATGVIICGGAEIGDNTFVGAGTIIRDGLKIAKNTIIGMGSIVVKDIEISATYLGTPLKKIR